MQTFILILCLSVLTKFSIIIKEMRKHSIIFAILFGCIGTLHATTRDARLTNTTGYNYNYMYPYMNNMIGGAEKGRHIDHQLPFIGLNKTSFTFNNLAILRADLRVRVHKNHYLTAMVNYARSGIDIRNFFNEQDPLLWSSLYDYNASNWWGAGLRYSLDTKVGPLNFDISSSNISKNINLYFSFGYYF